MDPPEDPAAAVLPLSMTLKMSQALSPPLLRVLLGPSRGTRYKQSSSSCGLAVRRAAPPREIPLHALRGPGVGMEAQAGWHSVLARRVLRHRRRLRRLGRRLLRGVDRGHELQVRLGFLFYISTEDVPREQRYALLDDRMDDDLIEKGPATEGESATSPNKAPCLSGPGSKRSWWFWPIMLLTFFSSVAWMNVIAGESVNAALSVAIVSRLSSSMLASPWWRGHSVGDLVADVAVANSGAYLPPSAAP